jgi:N-acetylglutamate synthase-like GNAT family acetyltransferase
VSAVAATVVDRLGRGRTSLAERLEEFGWWFQQYRGKVYNCCGLIYLDKDYLRTFSTILISSCVVESGLSSLILTVLVDT